MSLDPINVDFLINSPRVKADAAAVKKEIMGVDETAQKSAQKVSEVVTKAYANNVRSVDAYAQAVTASNAALAATTKQVAMARPQFNGLGNSVNQITRELPNFAISAQVGFMALSNNIPILADEITKLKKANEELVASGQKGVPVWKSILSVLANWQTLLLVGVTLTIAYSKQIGNFFSTLFKGKGVIDAVKQSQEALNKAFTSKAYTQAIADVIEMRGAFDLAKQGVLDKTDALEQYNDGLGKVFGSAEDLNEAERLFIANSDKYVEAMLYREAAALSAAESAAKLAEMNRKEEELLIKQEEAQARVVKYNQERFKQQGADPLSNPLLIAQKDVQQAKDALDELASDRETFIDESIKSYERLRSKSLLSGLNLDPKAGTGKAVSGRQSLLDQIAALDREYARKKLDDDEAEIAALQDKLDRMRELVIRFNNDPKNKDAKISLTDLDAVGSRAMDNLRQAQASERLAKLRKEAEQAREEQEAAWAKELLSLQDYQAKRQAKEQDYQKRREALVKAGKEREAAVLDEQHRQELDALDDAELKKLASYKAFFQDVNGLSIRAIKSQKDNIDRALADGQMNGVLLSDEQIRVLSEMSDKLKSAINSQSVSDLSKIAASVRNLGDGWAQVANQIDVAAAAMNAFQEIETLRTTAGASPIPAIGAVLGVVAMIDQGIQAARAQAQQNRRDIEDYITSVMDYQRQYNIAMRDAAIQQAETMEMDIAGIEARRDAYSNALNQNKQDAEELLRVLYEQGQYASGIELKMKKGGIFKGPTVEAVNQYSSLLGKTIEEIQALYANDQLSDRARELFEQLQALQSEGADIQAMLDDMESSWNQMITGTTADTIASTIADGLAAGYNSVEDFAGDMEDILANALISAMGVQVLKPLIDAWYAELGDTMEDGVIDELERQKLREQWNTIVQTGIDTRNAVFKASGVALPSSTSSGGLKGAIQRDLTEDTASELTGLYRSTYDLMKQSYEVAYMHYMNDQQVMSATMRMLAHTAAIEVNTRDTVLELRKAVKELKLISGTGVTGDNFDRGVGSS